MTRGVLSDLCIHCIEQCAWCICLFDPSWHFTRGCLVVMKGFLICRSATEFCRSVASIFSPCMNYKRSLHIIFYDGIVILIRICCFKTLAVSQIVPSIRCSCTSTAWPSGLRRSVKAAVRKGAGSNPAAVTLFIFADQRWQNGLFRQSNVVICSDLRMLRSCCFIFCLRFHQKYCWRLVVLSSIITQIRNEEESIMCRL